MFLNKGVRHEDNPPYLFAVPLSISASGISQTHAAYTPDKYSQALPYQPRHIESYLKLVRLVKSQSSWGRHKVERLVRARRRESEDIMPRSLYAIENFFIHLARVMAMSHTKSFCPIWPPPNARTITPTRFWISPLPVTGNSDDSQLIGSLPKPSESKIV
jgi:hypothetical protein